MEKLLNLLKEKKYAEARELINEQKVSITIQSEKELLKWLIDSNFPLSSPVAIIVRLLFHKCKLFNDYNTYNKNLEENYIFTFQPDGLLQLIKDAPFQPTSLLSLLTIINRKILDKDYLKIYEAYKNLYGFENENWSSTDKKIVQKLISQIENKMKELLDLLKEKKYAEVRELINEQKVFISPKSEKELLKWLQDSNFPLSSPVAIIVRLLSHKYKLFNNYNRYNKDLEENYIFTFHADGLLQLIKDAPFQPASLLSLLIITNRKTSDKDYLQAYDLYKNLYGFENVDWNMVDKKIAQRLISKIENRK